MEELEMEETGTESPTALDYSLPTPMRLLIAFVIGLPTTMMFPFSGLPTPFWWSLVIPLFILLVALMVRIVRDPVVQRGMLGAKQVRTAVITSFGVILAYYIALMVMGNLSAITAIIVLALVPLVVGLVSAFVAGAGRTKRFARLCGFVAWLGAALPNLPLVVLDARASAHLPDVIKLNPGMTEGAFMQAALTYAVAAHLIGLAVAAYGGGELGWRLRKRLLGPLAVGERPSVPEPDLEEEE